MTEVFIVSGVRTAIGDFGGALKDIAPGELATKVARAALDRAGVANDAVGHVVFGQVIPTEPRDAYLARVAGIGAGLPVEVPALTVNRLCGSGLQAVVSAAQSILLGDCDVAVAGGAENMSRAPYLLPDARWGSKMGDARVVDYLNGALSDPFDRNLMGVTAERVAQRYGISRDDQDALALESHRRAARAQAEGRFTEQILPVEITVKRQAVQFATDEHVRPDLAPGDLAKLRTVFQKDGTVTAGNASGINDGAAAVVLASGEAVKRLGLTPLARLVGYAHAGVDPAYMGIGPIPATRKLLARTGLSVQDLTVIESNEAFAAQACAVARELDFAPDRVNPNGSGISLGHPVGATGAINLVKAVYELRRVGHEKGRGGRALVTMCVGGGQGIAALIESV